MATYATNPSTFRRFNPSPTPRTVLSIPPSTWSSLQLAALRVLYKSSRLPSILNPFRPAKLPNFLETQLRLFPSASFQIPRHILPHTTSLYQLYSALATVVERSTAASVIPRDSTPRARRQTHRAPGFISSEDIGLSDISSNSGTLLSGSVEEGEKERCKDERAVIALVNAFLEDVITFGEAGEAGQGRKIEWTPVAEIMDVCGDGWHFVAEDDGGLVVRELVGGVWKSGPRVVSMERKSRTDGINEVRTVAQHAAELLGEMKWVDGDEEGP